MNTSSPSSSSSSSQPVCQKCGKPIMEGSPRGLCPLCLISVVAKTEASAPADVPPPELDELLAAFPQFENLEPLGVGGMGRVYKARHAHLDRTVALKLLPPAYANDPEWVERFTREARALARLNHPNIVQVHDFGEATAGTGEAVRRFPFLIMEFVDGVNLRQALRSGTLTAREALAIVPSLCAALQYAHDQGVLHRDIKPENILLDTQGRVKIADFGLAKLHGEAVPGVTLTATGAQLGTAAYMAPEQLEKPHEVDHRADIYSLGVVFYEMLTGELPLGRFLAPSEKAGTDPRLDTIVFRTLEKERDRRFQTATEMKSEVDHVASTAPQIPRPAKPARWPVALVFSLVLLPVALVALLVLMLGIYWLAARESGPSAISFILVPAVVLILVAGLVYGLTWIYTRLRRAGWSAVAAGLAMGLALAVLPVGGCVAALVLPVVARAPLSGHFRSPSNVVVDAANPSGDLPKGSIELLGVSHHAAQGQPGWRMDGSPMAGAPFVFETAMVAGSGHRVYDFVFKTTGLPEGTHLISWEVRGATEWTHSTQVALASAPDAMLKDHVVVSAALAQGAATANMRGGFGFGEWNTIFETGQGGPGSVSPEFEGVRWPLSWSDSTETKDGDLATSWHAPHKEDWETRVVAIKDGDTEIEATSRNESNDQISYRFPKLPVTQLKKLRFQVRRVLWVEFRGIKLAPSEARTTQALSSFQLHQNHTSATPDSVEARWEVTAGSPGWATLRFMGEQQSAQLRKDQDGVFKAEIHARLSLSRTPNWARLQFAAAASGAESDANFEEPAGAWFANVMNNVAKDGQHMQKEVPLMRIGPRSLILEISSTQPGKRGAPVDLTCEEVRVQLYGNSLTVTMVFQEPDQGGSDLLGRGINMSNPQFSQIEQQAVGSKAKRRWTWQTLTSIGEGGRPALQQRLEEQFLRRNVPIYPGETLTLFSVPTEAGRDATAELVARDTGVEKR